MRRFLQHGTTESVSECVSERVSESRALVIRLTMMVCGTYCGLYVLEDVACAAISVALTSVGIEVVHDLGQNVTTTDLLQDARPLSHFT